MFLAGSNLWLPLAHQGATGIAPAHAATHAGESVPYASAFASSQKIDPRLSYAADVIRVIDGDTSEARVRVWPGLDVDAKVRLRGIDAPELHARCAEEHVKAEAARAALETMLADGGVAISQVGIDKYGGRVDAASRHPQHGRRVRRAAQWRLRAQLQWRKARVVVLSPGTSSR